MFISATRHRFDSQPISARRLSSFLPLCARVTCSSIYFSVRFMFAVCFYFPLGRVRAGERRANNRRSETRKQKKERRKKRQNEEHMQRVGLTSSICCFLYFLFSPSPSISPSLYSAYVRIGSLIQSFRFALLFALRGRATGTRRTRRR